MPTQYPLRLYQAEAIACVMNIDDIRPNIEPFRGIYEPAREIALDPETETRVQTAVETLDRSGFEVSDIFDVFHDWKSRQTIAARRVIFSLGTLIGASHWIGVDLSNASIWGLSLGDASLGRFLAVVTLIHVFSALVYGLSRQLDARIRSARIVRTTDMIEPCRAAAREIEQSVQDNGLSSVDELIDDFTAVPSHQHTGKDAYHAVCFYEQELENAHTIRRWMDAGEVLGVIAVAAYTFYAIAQMAWSFWVPPVQII